MPPRSKRARPNVRNNWLGRDPVEEEKMEELSVQASFSCAQSVKFLVIPFNQENNFLASIFQNPLRVSPLGLPGVHLINPIASLSY